MPSISNEYKYYTNNQDECWIDDDLLEKMAIIDNLNFPFPWTKEVWKKLKINPANILIVTQENNGRLIGLSLFKFDEIELKAHLEKLIIDREFRGRGLGLKIMTHSVYRLEDFGIKTFTLEVEENNLSAIKLYKNMGFSEIHHIKKYYSNGHNASVMRRVSHS